MPADPERYNREISEILSDPAYGADEDSRRSMLGSARRLTLLLNLLSAVLAIGVIGCSQTRILGNTALGTLDGVLLGLPWIGLWALARYPVIRLASGSKRSRSAYPNLFSPFVLAPLALAVSAAAMGTMVSYGTLAISALLVGAAVALAFIIFVPFARKDGWAKVVFIAFGIFYSAAALSYANKALDRAPVEWHWSKVIERSVTYGRHANYHLELSPWLGQPGAGSVTVSKRFYDARGPGASVIMVLHKGALEIPWYTLR